MERCVFNQNREQQFACLSNIAQVTLKFGAILVRTVIFLKVKWVFHLA